MKQIKLIEVKSEIGAGTRGASMGIDALKIAALDFGSYFFKRNKSVKVPVENRLLLEPIKNEFAKRIVGVYTVVDKLSKEVQKAVEAPNTFPIVLLGDHSSSMGTVAGIKMAHPDKRLGVIWIDAHADIHSPYTTPSGNMHGMPIAAMLDEDNMENKVNNPEEETIQYWEKLKSLGGIKPKILPSDLIYVSMRDT
ncbi:MAG TPA: arginase family protein, partial [Bacteroidia bacterium]|nr:arginase family protein [Bacteroidia bacterium]